VAKLPRVTGQEMCRFLERRDSSCCEYVAAITFTHAKNCGRRCQYMATGHSKSAPCAASCAIFKSAHRFCERASIVASCNNTPGSHAGLLSIYCLVAFTSQLQIQQSVVWAMVDGFPLRGEPILLGPCRKGTAVGHCWASQQWHPNGNIILPPLAARRARSGSR
jgi:hypothetical protein